MKLLFFLLVLSVNLRASVDERPDRAAGEKLPRKTFQKIIGLFETTFSPLAERNGRRLVIMADYEENWAQAFARRWEEDQVIVYGGIAALENGTEDSFALILCHETGHLYGGRPVGDEHNFLSLEGQADYWATRVCFPEILGELTPRTPSPASLSFCGGETTCARAADAALVVTAHFADNRGLPHPALLTPDLTVAGRTLQTHPHPQCRLDTFLAGSRGYARPVCWYRP